MPTQNQLRFISDCESAVAAVKAQNRVIKRIGEVMDAAGRTLPELNCIAGRLASKGDFNELTRLQTAFNSVGLDPSCLKKALAVETESGSDLVGQLSYVGRPIEMDKNPNLSSFELERALPDEPKKPIEGVRFFEKMSERKPVLTHSEALASVIDILTPMSTIFKQRILQSAGLFLGVGE